MTYDNLDVKFTECYVKYPLSAMVDALDEYLHTEPFEPFHSNQHWVYLTSQMKHQKQDRKVLGGLYPTELPGMVYGMWCNAWKKLLEDMWHSMDENPTGIQS